MFRALIVTIAYQRIVELIRSTDAATILRIAGCCDGHTILKPQSLVDAGLHVDVVTFITHTHQSDGTPKGTRFVDGWPVQELTGVCYLSPEAFQAQQN